MLRTVRTENGWVKGIEAADPRITAFKGILCGSSGRREQMESTPAL